LLGILVLMLIPLTPVIAGAAVKWTERRDRRNAD
jgi:hypothetical protein